MFELSGKYATAKVFTDVVDNEAISQVINLLNQPYAEGSQVRMMPDIHAGAGCTIGTTMLIKDRICPNLVGADIGCGVVAVCITAKQIDPQKLDAVIRRGIPSGSAVRDKAHDLAAGVDLTKLCCRKYIDLDCATYDIGTLGGGNHFIEAGKDKTGKIYIVIHSGSRHLGRQIANYYQEAAYRSLTTYPKDLAYLEGELFEQYIHDMKIAQQYAQLNRSAMIDTIVKGMDFHIERLITTVHNYIDTENMILRKGAVSAQAGEAVLIPINMRDGILLCFGKGNEDWNFSAPHGAGRLMSRGEAKERFTVPEFERQMDGIYTTSVGRSTLDECPMAYKAMKDIVDNIRPTAWITDVIKPIYNFKPGESK